MAGEFGRCVQQIVTEQGVTIRCEKYRFHNPYPHEATDDTHIYRWKLESYPIGWQSILATKEQTIGR